MMSGFRMSPPPALIGPRDENDAVNGAAASYTTVPFEIDAVLPAAAAALIASRCGHVVTAGSPLVTQSPERWIVGTKWRSPLIEFGLVLTRIIPIPPASLTARLLSVRPFTPRSQTTIFPATFARSSTGVLSGFLASVYSDE